MDNINWKLNISVEDFVVAMDSNLDQLIEQAETKPQPGKNSIDEAIYKTCLRFTKQFVREFYLSASQSAQMRPTTKC